MTNVIEVTNLKKRYPSTLAVAGVTFSVRKGEVFGLLGENGAGKTTTLEIIEGIRKPSEGTVRVFGKDVTKPSELRAVKDRIGVQLQSTAYYKFLTVREILELFGSFYDRHLDPDKLIAMVGLEEKTNAFVGSLSGGQQQRFSIAASLLNDPEIVFLDEPTTGLDPRARRNLWELIESVKAQGKTIVLTTHYMEEAELLCDRIAIMDAGKIAAIDTTAALIKRASCPVRIDFSLTSLSDAQAKVLRGFGELTSQGEAHSLGVARANEAPDAAAAILKLKPAEFSMHNATLEDVFIELTGKRIEA